MNVAQPLLGYRLLDRCEESETSGLREKCWTFCQELLEATRDSPSPFLLGAIVDLHSDRLESMGKEDKERASLELKGVRELCARLAGEIDPIRKEYWSYMDRDLHARFA